jgi:hypothetical protein
MQVSNFEGASEVLLAEEPDVNELTRRFAEDRKERLDLPRFERLIQKQAGRAATPRDHMRLFTHLLIADKERPILSFLHGRLEQKTLLEWYARHVAAQIEVRPDGPLGVGRGDWRLVNYEIGALATFQGHDPFGGSFEQVIEDFGKARIAEAIWGEIWTDLDKRKAAAKKVAAALPATPSWASSEVSALIAPAGEDTATIVAAVAYEE